MNPALEIINTPLHRLQQDCAARINANVFFHYVEAVAIRDLQTLAAIEQGLSGVKRKNGKSGAGVQVLMSLLDVDKPNPAGPITVGRITLRCQELPAINYGASGTRLSSEELALKCLDIFHHWSPGYLATLRAGRDAVNPNLDFSPRITHDVTFTFDLALAQTSKVLTPQISVSGGLVTITCATAAAEIYYTIDESLPTKAPPNGSLYTDPFTAPDAGVVVRAVGVKTDLSDSNASETTIE